MNSLIAISLQVNAWSGKTKDQDTDLVIGTLQANGCPDQVE